MQMREYVRGKACKLVQTTLLSRSASSIRDRHGEERDTLKPRASKDPSSAATAFTGVLLRRNGLANINAIMKAGCAYSRALPNKRCGEAGVCCLMGKAAGQERDVPLKSNSRRESFTHSSQSVTDLDRKQAL